MGFHGWNNSTIIEIGATALVFSLIPFVIGILGLWTCVVLEECEMITGPSNHRILSKSLMLSSMIGFMGIMISLILIGLAYFWKGFS